MAADGAALHLLELELELLDLSMGLLEILVKAVALSNKLLLPLAEAVLLDLDLLSEALPESLFLLLELGVVKLPWPGLAKLARLHLLGTVRLVVQLLRGVNEVEHVRPDHDGPELLEVAVVFVLDLGNAPRVLTALGNATVGGLNILLRADDSEGHGGHEDPGILGGVVVVGLDRGLVNLDVLRLNDGPDLHTHKTRLDGLAKKKNKKKIL